MKTIEHVIESWADPVHILPIADAHLGNRAADEALIERTASKLENPNTYWINLGDTIDAINMRDPRFEAKSLARWIGVDDLSDIVGAQVSRYKHFFGRYGETCLASVIGNHEAAASKYFERNVYREINEALGIKPDDQRVMGLSGFLRLRFREVLQTGKHKNTWTVVIYLHHGWGGGRLAGAKAIKLQRLPSSYAADVYIIGHTHTKLVLPHMVLRPAARGDAVEERDLMLVNTGSFLGLANYAEANGYAGQPRGAVELVFYPSERRIEAIV